MSWSRENAANAYLDTLKLRARLGNETSNDATPTTKLAVEPQNNEFISALAAGMGAKLIVQVSPEASQSTVALAAAARQTGGRLVCILPEEAPTLSPTKAVIQESGLNDMVEFRVGDPRQLLSQYENIDFSLVDCSHDSYAGLLRLLDVNPRRSVVVANRLGGGKEGLRGDVPGKSCRGAVVRSVKRPIGEGMEVTVIGGGGGEMEEVEELGKGSPPPPGRNRKRARTKSKWVKKIDHDSGEEHIFRVPMSPSFNIN